MTDSPSWQAIAGLLTGVVCGLLGWAVCRWRYERDRGLMDGAWKEGEQDGYDAACDDYGLVPRVQQTAVIPAVMGGGPGDTEAGQDQAWAEQLHEMNEQRVADLEDLPGRERMPSPAGEHHPRIIDLGREGDAKMLTRDWFARRDFAASIGFEITEHGHMILAAA